MIYWLTREDYATTVEELCRGLDSGYRGIRPLSYEQVYEKRAPRGHYIFSDFDRLSSYEIECAIVLMSVTIDDNRIHLAECQILA